MSPPTVSGNSWRNFHRWVNIQRSSLLWLGQRIPIRRGVVSDVVSGCCVGSWSTVGAVAENAILGSAAPAKAVAVDAGYAQRTTCPVAKRRPLLVSWSAGSYRRGKSAQQRA